MIAAKYVFFSAISILLNVFSQYLSLTIFPEPGGLYIAIIVGTFAGLVSKYIFDKKYIFYHTSKNRTDDVREFTLYSLMGVVTTSIFWGTELAFYYWFENENAKYVGAIIGLCVGYFIKYFLDKKYVFSRSAT